MLLREAGVDSRLERELGVGRERDLEGHFLCCVSPAPKLSLAEAERASSHGFLLAPHVIQFAVGMSSAAAAS